MQTLHITASKKGQYEAMIKIHMYSTATWLKALTVRFILILGGFITFKHWLISDTKWTYSNYANVHSPIFIETGCNNDRINKEGESCFNQKLIFSEFVFMCVTYTSNCQNVIRQILPNLSQRLKLSTWLIILFDFKIYFSVNVLYLTQNIVLQLEFFLNKNKYLK